MGMLLGQADPRLVEWLRGELAQTLCASFAYPPLYDFGANRAASRPIDSAKRAEIAAYSNSINFTTLANADITAHDIPRFIERAIVRFIEVNALFDTPYHQRVRPMMRAQAPQAAAALHQALRAVVAGESPPVTTPAPRRSWATPSDQQQAPDTRAIEHNTQVLESVLMRAGKPAGARAPQSAPGIGATTDAASLSASQAGLGALGKGAQSGLFARKPKKRKEHEPTPELIGMYEDYLHDMQPEIMTEVAQTPYQPDGDQRAAAPGWDNQPESRVSSRVENNQDQQIFFQLRNQIVAYIRRAASSYGIPDRGDPYAMLDALRRSNLVDESNLRIAEGILAFTDRIAENGTASHEDYRQVLMLYLLYHRSQLGT